MNTFAKWLLPFAAFVSSCITIPKVTDQKPEDHPVRKAAYWAQSQKLTLQEKLISTPPDLVDYLVRHNSLTGLRSKPALSEISSELRSDVTTALASIPETIQTAVNPKVIGIFFVKGLGTAAYTESVFDEANKETKALILLDADLVNRTANEYITQRENSTFEPAKDAELVVTLADSKNNTRAEAIHYVLLQQFAYALALGSDVLPSWHVDPQAIKDPDEYTFFPLSWYTQQNTFERHFELNEPLPGELVFYQNAPDKPRLSEAGEVYDWMARTNFATLYSVGNPFDDFADSFANYVHVNLEKKPYQVVFKNGKVSKTYGACWSETRCKSKREVIEQILNINR